MLFASTIRPIAASASRRHLLASTSNRIAIMSSTATDTQHQSRRNLATPTETKVQQHGGSSIPVPNDRAEASSSSSSSNGSYRGKALRMDTINPLVTNVQYAVRGELAIKADKYMHQLEEAGSSSSSLPFDKVVTANIGNPQQKGLDQKPITFWRQVISLLEYPELMSHPLADQIYPPDAIKRARTLAAEIGSTGAYTHSKGVLGIRKKVAKFIEERDGGHKADPESIYLTSGASDGVARVMNLALAPGDGVLIPIPQYPLYTATLAALDCKALPYNLYEPSAWSLSRPALREALDKAAADGTRVKALVVINPGNPTGGCLSREDMESIVQMCHDEGLVLMADEVYQNNIYDPDHKPFYSFKKILSEMKDAHVRENTELVSFMSISKGVSGECGRRGGYFEAINIDDKVLEQLYKMASISLCPPVSGQVGVDLLVDPPQKGDPSYELYAQETGLIHDNLLSRSAYMRDAFNKLPGMSCQPAEGAMYLFPKIDMPAKAIEHAKELGKPADVMYALDLLDATGICAVAGSGFGQEEGTYHLRVTALCPGVEDYVSKIEKFHNEFMDKYA